MTHKHPDTHRYTILNVDDNEVGRYAVNRILQKEGFRVREASTGEEALRRAAEMPDLIILDVHLPDMSGLDVCRKIKENPATSHIPILHLSATYTDAESKAEGLESGADSYLVQPVEPIVLISTIRALLRMHEAERRALAALKHWQTTFDAISDGVCLLDLDGRIRQCNQALARLLDKSESEIIGHRCRELLACDLPDAGGLCFDQIRKIGLRQSCELSFKDRCFQVTLDPVTG
jgi:DNA-binding response OmpR family regulator